jgi:hypothetical protein
MSKLIAFSPAIITNEEFPLPLKAERDRVRGKRLRLLPLTPTLSPKGGEGEERRVPSPPEGERDRVRGVASIVPPHPGPLPLKGEREEEEERHGCI